MPISFSCPHCGESMNVADQYAGSTGPCRSCQQTITIPGVAIQTSPGVANQASPVIANPTGVANPTGAPNPGGIYVEPPKRGMSGCAIAAIVVGCIAVLMIPLLLTLLLPAVSAAREAARRNGCMNNQRQITLAILNYEADHQRFPPAYTVDEDGNPLHSWRVLILPYLGEGALFDQIDLTKPWDDPANQILTETVMPTIYACPSSTGDTSKNTNYVVVVDETSAFPPGGRGRRIGEIADGVSGTVAVVETNSGGHWAEPVDVTMSELRSLGSDHRNGMNVSYLDGHVLFQVNGVQAGAIGVNDGVVDTPF